MYEPSFSHSVKRPAACPFCQSPTVDTLAKVFTVKTFWRCRECEQTWTIEGRAALEPKSRVPTAVRP